MKFEDKSVKCVDCNEEFTFTAGEQEFYNERGYTEPKRCKPCRDAKKAQSGNRRPRYNDENQAA